jgi:limonene-1,2-epoxide hydrolase
MQEYERLGTKYRLICEKVVNESWGEVSKFKDEIKGVLEKTGNLTDIDIILLKIAADAFVQKVVLSERMDQDILGDEGYLELSPCGENPKCQCPCSRAVCLIEK